VYSTLSFEIEVGRRRLHGPKPGDVFTTSKFPERQLMCLDNCVRLCPDGKRECSVLGLTHTGKRLVSPPTGVTVQGARVQFSCFDGITPEMVNEALKAHYLWIAQHLARAPLQVPPPETADVGRCHGSQVQCRPPSPKHLTNALI
jgi:hypothetical protein